MQGIKQIIYHKRPQSHLACHGPISESYLKLCIQFLLFVYGWTQRHNSFVIFIPHTVMSVLLNLRYITACHVEQLLLQINKNRSCPIYSVRNYQCPLYMTSNIYICIYKINWVSCDPFCINCISFLSFKFFEIYGTNYIITKCHHYSQIIK